MSSLKGIVLTLTVIAACSGMVYADSELFTPLDFSSASSSDVKIASTDTGAAPDVTGGKNMQSAINQLDSAQVEVRNELLNYKSEYSEVDAKYEALKTERSNLSKQVKTTESRINQIEKAKEKIRKNME